VTLHYATQKGPTKINKSHVTLGYATQKGPTKAN